MAKVTYTKGQLMAFTVKEMKTLDLFSKIDPKGLDKEGIVKAMISAQKAELKALKTEEAKSEIKKDTTPAPIKPVVETIEEVEEAEETEAPVEGTVEKAPVEIVEEEDVEEVVSSKPHFHRPLKKRNPMNFR